MKPICLAATVSFAFRDYRIDYVPEMASQEAELLLSGECIQAGEPQQ
jgi:hypothetical protein